MVNIILKIKLQIQDQESEGLAGYIKGGQKFSRIVKPLYMYVCNNIFTNVKYHIDYFFLSGMVHRVIRFSSNSRFVWKFSF